MVRPLHRSKCMVLLAMLAILTHLAWGQGMCGCEHRYDLLMDLYRSTNGSGWENKAGWGNMSSCSATWYGVTCSGGDVTSVNLQLNSLAGTLPLSWGNMGGLQHLYLNFNYLCGSLPSSWWNMSTLKSLNLALNDLSGSLPSSWGNMSALQQLHLNGNSLNGSLPSSWWNMSALQSLNLQYNPLSGSLSSSWGNMSALESLDLEDNFLSGSLPSSWGNMSKLQQLSLSSNSLSGSLPSSWGNMSNLQQLRLNRNSLSGSLPSSWGSMSALQTLYVYSNSLNGKVPASWANFAKLRFLHLDFNCLYGALPAGLQAMYEVSICNTRVVSTRYSCGKTDWAPSCRYPRSSKTASLSLLESRSSPLTSTAFRKMTSSQTTSRAASSTLTGTPITSLTSTHTRSNSVTVSGTWAASTASVSLNSHAASLTSTGSYLATRTSSHSKGVTVSGAWAPPTSTLSLNVSRSGTAMCRLGSNVSLGLVQFPLLNDATLLNQASVSTVVLLQPEENGATVLADVTKEVDIRCRSVARHELVEQPALGAALALPSGLPTCCRITNVTTGGQLVRLTHSRVGTPAEGMLSSSMLLVIASPLNGWLANTALLFDATILITITIMCGPDSHLSVVLSVPAPGAVRALAGQVESAVKYSQIASLATVGATSASSLGRLMAVRSMVLCDADSVVGGGVVDLGLSMCEADGALDAARSAVVSNVVLIVAAAALLLALAAVWSLATKASLRESLLVLCVPSSLLPVWTAVVPSTSASAALLGRLWGSPCAGTDAVLGLVGAVVALCPFAALVAFWRVSASGVTPALVCTMMSERREKLVKVDDALQACRWRPSWFTRAFERRWRWRSVPSNTGAAIPAGTTRCAWVVLLEYRVLWYAALDSLGLAVIACVAVVSGLGGSSLCRAWTVVALLLMAGQLVVVVIVQPFTTLFACVHAATTLGLTCVGVLGQLVYVFVGSDTSTSGLWLVEASGVCSLAVVGVSSVKTLLDVVALLRAVQRRVEKRNRTSPRIARGPVIDEGVDDVSGEWDQELLRRSSPAVLPWSVGNTNDDHIDDDKVTASHFWDMDGNARQCVIMQDDAVSDAPISGYFLL